MTVGGILVPDATGTYNSIPDIDGKQAYTNLQGEFSLWWHQATATWYLGLVIGTQPADNSPFWYNSDAPGNRPSIMHPWGTVTGTPTLTYTYP